MKDRTARGTALVNLLPLETGETVQAVVETRDFPVDHYLVFATARGQVKKTAFSEYDKSRREGFIAINLRDGDELVRVVTTNGTDDLFAVTRTGMTIRFSEDDVRPMGRGAAGVRGIRLRDGDELVSLDVARDESDILMVTDAGYGKRTKVERFNRQVRGGQGVRGIRLTAKRGRVVAAFMVGLDEEILLVSTGGVVIRTAVREIASQGRDATGVRVMNLDDGQTVAAVARGKRPPRDRRPVRAATHRAKVPTMCRFASRSCTVWLVVEAAADNVGCRTARPASTVTGVPGRCGHDDRDPARAGGEPLHGERVDRAACGSRACSR
jgi:DNA gyrase subunit A